MTTCRELPVKIPSESFMRIRPVVVAPLHAVRQTNGQESKSQRE